jgi:hypothetical protein
LGFIKGRGFLDEEVFCFMELVVIYTVSAFVEYTLLVAELLLVCVDVG